MLANLSAAFFLPLARGNASRLDRIIPLLNAEWNPRGCICADSRFQNVFVGSRPIRMAEKWTADFSLEGRAWLTRSRAAGLGRSNGQPECPSGSRPCNALASKALPSAQNRFLWCCSKTLAYRRPCCRSSDPMIMRGKFKISRWFALAHQTK